MLCTYGCQFAAGSQVAGRSLDLFGFWSKFLRSNFNDAILADFQRLAACEYERGSTHGARSLFQFYCEALQQHFRAHLYQSFELSALKVGSHSPEEKPSASTSLVVPCSAS